MSDDILPAHILGTDTLSDSLGVDQCTATKVAIRRFMTNGLPSRERRSATDRIQQTISSQLREEVTLHKVT